MHIEHDMAREAIFTDTLVDVRNKDPGTRQALPEPNEPERHVNYAHAGKPNVCAIVS